MTGFEEIERRMNITNSQEHPTNSSYTVFHFRKEEQAKYFTELLNENNIRFESDEEFSKGKTLYLFGILKTDLDKVTHLNYLVLGKNREHFIKNKGLKWAIILLGLSALALALVGYFLKK